MTSLPSTPCATVIASWIDYVNFAYRCPFCAKSHYHGSQGNLSNRIEERNSHCHKRKQVMRIIIDNSTRREFN